MDTPTNLLSKKFLGTITPAEEEKLNKWIENSEANRTIYAKAKQQWDEMGFASKPFTQDQELAWDMIASGIKPPKEQTNGSALVRLLKMTAIVLALFVTLGFLATFATFNTNSTITATTRAQKELLPDGTTAYLDSGTSIRYAKKLGKRSRTVTLMGDALFESTTINGLPLTIRTPQGKLTTNGGIIEVLCTPEKMESIAIAKELHLKTLTETISVEPQQMVTIDSTQVASVLPADYNLLAWKSGVIIAEEAPFGRLVRSLEKYTGRRIVAKSFVDYKQPLTFELHKPTTLAIADTLAKQLGMQAKVTAENIILF